jgi:hypothetical protein
MGERALPAIRVLVLLVAVSGCGGGGTTPDGGPVQCTGTLSGDLSGSFPCTTPTYQLVSGAYYTLSLSSMAGTLLASANLNSCSVSLIKDQSGFVVGPTYRDLTLDGQGTASAVTLTGKTYGGFTGAGTTRPVIVALTLTSIDMPSSTSPASHTHGTLDLSMQENSGTGKLMVHFSF